MGAEVDSRIQNPPQFEFEIDDEEVLSRVAWYYYHDGITQAEIAERMRMSRVKVSRLLERGRRLGIIEIRINSTFSSCIALERELVERFGLRDAVVIPALPGASANDRLGQATAQYLYGAVNQDDLIAVGWGDTVTKALQRFTYAIASRNVSVVSLTGGVADYFYGMGMSSLGERATHNIHLIPAPILASTPELAEAFVHEPKVAEMLRMVELASVAIVGIGALDEGATLVRSGYVTMSELRLFQRMGAVGDIIGHFFDANGDFLDLPIHARTVGFDPLDLKRIPLRVGTAGGAHKIPALLGALRGGNINVLVTDEPSAIALARED